MTQINPYLGFNGKCEEAFNFYKSVFGGEFTMLSRFEDAPKDSGMQTKEGEENRIMHMGLPIGANVLMGSDMPENQAATSNNISISVQADSEEDANHIFNALSEGGKITMPLSKTFWNAYFGMLTDKFGINWMINHDYGQN